MRWFKKIFFAFTRKEKVVFFVAAAATLVSFAVVSSMLVARGTTVVPAAGGDYTEGALGQPEYVNPVTAATDIDLGLVKMVYSNIYNVADKIEMSTDGRTWTVRLKENLHWQDGEKLTSDDVIFTVQSIQNEEAASPLYQSWQGVAASRTSELELQFNLANPYAFFRDNLKNLYIVPKHVFASVPVGNWRLSDYNLKPVGSGPYEFSSYEKQASGFVSAYHLHAWNKYFGEKALIENFDVRFFENMADLIKSFNSGQIDGMGGMAGTDLTSIDRPFDTFAWRTSSYYAVFLNQSKSLPLQDALVREALSAALDRDAILGTALASHGKPGYGPVPDGAPYFTSTISTTSLDFASTTLDNAGWKAGTDGFRAKSVQRTSIPLVVNLTVPQIDFLTKTADALKTAWEKIGVKVNITTDSPQNIVARAVKNRDYESLLFGNVLGASSDLYAFWNSSQRFYPGLNLAIYQNKKVDSLIASIRTNLDDASRASQFAQAQTIITSDNPAIFLYSPDYLYVTNKNVRGIAPDFITSPSEHFREAAKWYLNTARVLK